jgi:hypothetical protein
MVQMGGANQWCKSMVQINGDCKGRRITPEKAGTVLFGIVFGISFVLCPQRNKCIL